MVFLPDRTYSNIRCAKLMPYFKCLTWGLITAREMRTESIHVWAIYKQSSLTVVHSEVYASLPRYLVPESQSGETCRKLHEQGPLQPQELCTLFCKGCEPDRDGVVGLAIAQARAASLSDCQYSLAWDCLIKLIEGPEGQRGWVPLTSPCGRAIDIP